MIKIKKYLTFISILTAFTFIASGSNSSELLVWGDATRIPDFERYQAANPDISMRIVTVNPADAPAKIQLAMKAGEEVPDALFMDSITWPSQLTGKNRDYLLDLRPYVDQAILDNYYAGANAPCEFGEELLCLRNDLAQMSFWYSKTQFEEYGYKAPNTWQEFEDLGLKIAKEHPGKIIGTAAEGYPLMSYFFASDCPISFPTDVNTVHINLSGEKCTRMANLLDNLIAAGTLSLDGAWDAPYSAAAKNGDLLAMLAPSWYGEYVFKAGYEYPSGTMGMALPPVWPGEERYTGAWGGGEFGGYKGTKNPQLVADMLVWLTTNEDNTQHAVTFPAYKPASISWGAQVSADTFYAEDIFPAMRDSAGLIHPLHKSLRYELGNAFGKILVPGIKSGKTVLSLLPDLEKEIINMAKVARYRVVTN